VIDEFVGGRNTPAQRCNQKNRRSRPIAYKDKGSQISESTLRHSNQMVFRGGKILRRRTLHGAGEYYKIWYLAWPDGQKNLSLGQARESRQSKPVESDYPARPGQGEHCTGSADYR